MEYLSKMLYYCSNKMSCIPPNPYRKRFNEYMKDKFVDFILGKEDKNKNLEAELDILGNNHIL